jgi:hypothetical protein
MDKVRYVLNEICNTWHEAPVFANVRESFAITCFTRQPSLSNLRDFFKTVFLGQYDIGEVGMRFFTVGFVENIQVCARMVRKSEWMRVGRWARVERVDESG